MPNLVSCNETFGSREANREVASGGRVVDTFVRRFRIVLDGGGYGADVVASSAPQLPLVREPHPLAPFARAKSVKCSPESPDDKIWIAEINYSSDVQEESQQPENPLDEPPQKGWSFAQFTRPVSKDINGNAIVNAAKELFDPAPERDDSRLVFRYQRNQPSFPHLLANQYQDAVNSDQFLGFRAGYVKCQNISADYQFKNDVYYWSVSYEFHFRSDDEDEDDWQLHVLNQGYRELNGLTYSVIRDAEGLPLNQPALLDANGQQLDADWDDPVFLDFDIYRNLPFSVFNISL